MVTSKKTEKWSKKYLCTRVPEAVIYLLDELRPLLLMAILSVCFDWIILGLRPLRTDQIIFFVAATTASIISHVPSFLGSKFIHISSEILVFLLSETAVFAATVMNGVWLWNLTLANEDDIHLLGAYSAMGYWTFSFPVVNTVVHLILIYNLFSGTGEKVFQYSIAVKAVCWIPGVIVIYALVPFVCSLPKEIDVVALMLVNAQIGIALAPVLYTVSELKWGEQAKILKKWFDLSAYYEYIVALALLPVLISTALIATKYGIASVLWIIKDVIEADIAAITEARKQQEANKWFEASSQSGLFLECIRSTLIVICGVVYSFRRYRILDSVIYAEWKIKPKTSTVAASLPGVEI